eukprot:717286-Amphidinium_carterae.1
MHVHGTNESPNTALHSIAVGAWMLPWCRPSHALHEVHQHVVSSDVVLYFGSGNLFWEPATQALRCVQHANPGFMIPFIYTIICVSPRLAAGVTQHVHKGCGKDKLSMCVAQ